MRRGYSQIKEVVSRKLAERELPLPVHRRVWSQHSSSRSLLRGRGEGRLPRGRAPGSLRQGPWPRGAAGKVSRGSEASKLFPNFFGGFRTFGRARRLDDLDGDRARGGDAAHVLRGGEARGSSSAWPSPPLPPDPPPGPQKGSRTTSSPSCSCEYGFSSVGTGLVHRSGSLPPRKFRRGSGPRPRPFKLERLDGPVWTDASGRPRLAPGKGRFGQPWGGGQRCGL